MLLDCRYSRCIHQSLHWAFWQVANKANGFDVFIGVYVIFIIIFLQFYFYLSPTEDFKVFPSALPELRSLQSDHAKSCRYKIDRGALL